MGKNRSKQKKEKKSKSYLIKMPVYTTTSIDNLEGFFGGISFIDLVNFLKRKLDNFQPITSPNRNQTSITVVNTIEPIDVNIGAVPCLLLKVSYYKTNVYDGYFESNEKIKFSQNSKIGSDSNYILFYPRIVGTENQTCFYLMVAYEDPGKLNNEVAKLGKLISNKVFDRPVKNIKISEILQELKEIGTIPELEIRFSSLENMDDDIGIKYREYLQKSELTKSRKQNFKNIPADTAEELVMDSGANDPYQKKTSFYKIGKKEFRITKKIINDTSAEINEFGEKIFNAESAITEQELKNKVYNIDFMTEKMNNVISNFLESDE